MESGVAQRGETPLVVVCEDTESIRRLMRINLELEGFDVEEFTDGAAAVAALAEPRHRVPSAVVFDAQMGGGDGYWAIDQLRHDPRLAQVPALLVTASYAANDPDGVADAGFDGVLAKPFDPQALIDAVSRLAGAGRAASGPA